MVSRRSSPDVRRILGALPDWFGDPVAIENYAAAAADGPYDSRLAVLGGTVVGVALTRRHFPASAELHLIAVHPTVHGRGVGSALVESIAAELAADGCRFLSVHTVGPSFDHEPYARTRAFYERLGFTPLEEHHGLDWSGPSVILVRPLGSTGPTQ
nr:GNAT family N-acetyltransferase [Curtobacterium sp. ER1/6]